MMCKSFRVVSEVLDYTTCACNQERGVRRNFSTGMMSGFASSNRPRMQIAPFRFEAYRVRKKGVGDTSMALGA